MNGKNPYDVLGVAPRATSAQIRRAYLLRAKMLHPDRFDPASQREEWDLANEMLKELNHAYEVLADAESRAAFDNAVPRNDVFHTPSRPQSPATTPDCEINHQWPRWLNFLASSLARRWEWKLDQVLSRCQQCKFWWSPGDEISREELGRQPAWTNVTRSQSTYRQDRDPAYTFVTEWQETVPVIRVHYRVTFRCPKCKYTRREDVQQNYHV
jgi:hypothetical protein